MFALILNDMRKPKIEYCDVICVASTRQEIVDLVESETVPLYKDNVYGYEYHKQFRKDGPLGWYNKPFDLDRVDCHGQGIVELKDDESTPEFARSIDDLYRSFDRPTSKT